MVHYKHKLNTSLFAITATQTIMMEVESPTEPPTSHIDRGTGTLTADASRLFRVYKTISSLLSKRGYMVSREMRDMTPMDFTNRFGEFPTREGLTILVVS